MTPEKMLKDVKKQFNQLLKQHPEEKKHSTGYVADHLELRHIKAATWLEKHHKTRMNAYNLHDLILNYDQYKQLAELSPDDMVMYDGLELKETDFNPAHLVEYFRK